MNRCRAWIRRLLERTRNGVRLGRALGKLGFTASPIACTNCGHRPTIRRDFTAEYWCAKCGYGALWPGTKQRDEVVWFFGATQ